MQTDELADHLFASALGTLDILSVHLGDRFGLYDVLAGGPLDEAEVSRRSGMHPRYTREWLEQQVVSGLIEVDDPARAPESRRYSLPAEHAAVLADRDGLAYFAPFARLLAAAAVQLPALEEAYRTGGGVGWAAYGEQMRTAQAEANRPLYLGPLGSEWLPALPDVHQASPTAAPSPTSAAARAGRRSGSPRPTRRPGSTATTSTPRASRRRGRHAEERGLGDRVKFHLVDGAGGGEAGSYDLVTAFECVHDLPDPVSVLMNARRLVRAGGTVLVMDERVPESFTGPGDPVEQLMYGFSLLVCLPDGLSHDGSVGTGTVMRPDRLRAYAREAGFVDLEVLPIENDVFRFYRLFG